MKFFTAFLFVVIALFFAVALGQEKPVREVEPVSSSLHDQEAEAFMADADADPEAIEGRRWGRGGGWGRGGWGRGGWGGGWGRPGFGWGGGGWGYPGFGGGRWW